MFNARLLAKFVAVQIVFIPVVSFADDDTELNMALGRADVFLKGATDGLTKLEASKNKLSDKWANELVGKANDVCQFIKEELKKSHSDDPDVEVLCQTE